MLTQEQKKVRRRFFEDFAFYAAKAVTIRTKDQKLVPLVLNRAQKHLLERIYAQLERRGYARIIILKGRQMGSSTFVEAFLYFWVSQRKAQKALVVAHDIPATQTVFEMTKRLHDNCPDILRPQTRSAGRKELHFGTLDSGYRIATAGGDGIVRGDTITAAHLSEVAWWPAGSAKENYSGLMDAVPRTPGTLVFEESTANGFNSFWEHWKAAEKGTSDFEPVFLPWFWDPGYTAPVPDHFERTPKEEELAALYSLSDEQLMFRRLKVAEKGEELFRQEYPNCADEAFLTSGRPVFNPDRVNEMLRNVREPIRLEALNGTGKARKDGKHQMAWEEDPLGELKVYLEHDPKETYYVGADVGFGVRKDFSVAQVFDSKRQQVAVWRSDRYNSDFFGTVLAHLGRRYNDAKIICERNGPGILTNRVIHNDEGYPYVHRETQYDKVTDTETVVIGFLTTVKSKPLVIDQLRAHVRDAEIHVYDKQTLEEMQTFVVTESGRMEADKGSHDDAVMALALADHINEGPWTPISNHSEWYGTID